MRVWTLPLFTLGFSAILAMQSVSFADSDPMEAAQKAYDAVDFETALPLARAARDRGGYSQKALVRINTIIGICTAQLGQTDEAIDAFRMVLMLDPNARPDDKLSPELKVLVMKARSYWRSHDAFSVSEKPTADGLGIAVTVVDPLGVASDVHFHYRVDRTNAFGEVKQSVQPTTVFAIPGFSSLEHVEYWVSVDDHHGNIVAQMGSDSEPAIIDRAPHVMIFPFERTRDRGPDYTWPVAGFVVGAVGIGFGTAFGFAAIGNKKDLDAHCVSGSCPPTEQSALNAFRLNGALSTVSFIVGAVGVSFGSISLALTKKSIYEAPRSARLTPWIGPQGFGILGEF